MLPNSFSCCRLAEGADRPNNFRALYDIPHMFEAREFLRKKLIGHNVQVIVDYVQPGEKCYVKLFTLACHVNIF